MRPIRFIHTSDIHLDTSFSSCGFPSRLGGRKREAIRSTFRRILENALVQKVDVILIAGDLFEHDRITPDTVEFIKQQFANLGDTPVFISPGNHDPYIHGSPYCEERWPPNVHIFGEEEFRSVEIPDLGVRVTGFGFNRTRLEDRPFLKLPTLPPDGINLVVSHGSDVAQVPTGKFQHGPFTIAEIAGKNVHYCALGHYHQQRQVANAIDQTQAWYSGIPEGRGWDETGECGYILAEIEADRLNMQKLTCNQYPLQTISVNCDGLASREQILEVILRERSSGFDANTILRVCLEGSPDPSLDLSFMEMEERLAGSFLHVEWEDETQPALDFIGLAQEKTLRGRFARTLNDRLRGADGDERIIMDRARLYGIQALLGRNVRPL